MPVDQTDSITALRRQYKFLPKDYLLCRLPACQQRTSEGLLACFAVVAPGIQQGRVLACLRYVAPISNAEPLCWQKLTTREATNLLTERWPACIFHCSKYDCRLPGVVPERIAAHYRPEIGLAHWITETDVTSGPQGWSEQSAASQASWLSAAQLASVTASSSNRRESSTPPSPSLNRPCVNSSFRHVVQQVVERMAVQGCHLRQLGLTGSLAVGAAHDRSDIDIVVYGLHEMSIVQRAIEHKLHDGGFQELDRAHWQRAFERRGCDLSFSAYVWHERRKRNKFLLDGRRVDVSCVCLPHWIADQSGAKLARVQSRCRVTDAAYAMASPATYRVDAENFEWIVCGSPTYAGQAVAGELVECQGWLEETECGNRRLYIGSSREAEGEFLRVIH